MIAAHFLTFGVYDYYWFLRGRAALNQLDSPRKRQMAVRHRQPTCRA